jgi:hypothetical protein
MAEQIPTSDASAHEPSPDDLPKTVLVVRLTCAVGAALALTYIWLGSVELSYLESGRAPAGDVVGHHFVLQLANRVRDFIVSTIGLSIVVFATMLPFALLTSRLRNWARIAMILISLGAGTFALLVISIDAGTLQTGTLQGFGPVEAERMPQISAMLIKPWFPFVHYVIGFGLLVTAVVAAIGLLTATARDYFRRLDQVTDDDPRIWSVARLRTAAQNLRNLRRDA